MVKYWIRKDSAAEVVEDYKDIANGKYEPNRLKQDILETWKFKSD